MTFEEYQKESRRTAKYPNIGSNFVYPTLGLSGESGEVAEKVKKIIRDAEGVVSEEARTAIQKELGDVLWYLSQIATELKISLDAVAEENLKKLLSRLERDVISGSGDDH
ncbi:MAG: nucleoside triphosphate pyrophosphohydrolase family protein [Patescibacteria group bacterium]